MRKDQEGAWMDTACYYTFSTICQTLAGAFGFLVAVVLYRLNQIPGQILVILPGAKAGRGLENNSVFNRAVNEGNWLKVADILEKTDLLPSISTSDREVWNRDRANFIRVAKLLDSLVIDLRKALFLTSTTIAFSLCFLAITPLLVYWKVVAVIVIALDVSAAIACLYLFYRLAKDAVE
jgi:hypothetical protein